MAESERSGNRLFDEVFDDEHYAASVWQKMKRALELGPKYYCWDVPQYIRLRRGENLPICDWPVLWNPLREFRRSASQVFDLPDGFAEALQLIRDAGIRLTMPRNRLEALAGAWWTTREVRGDIIECGAYRGATSLLLATLCRLHSIDKRVFVLDSFEGVSASSRYDVSRTGWEFVPAPKQVAIIRQQADALNVGGQIEICKGMFAETFPQLAEIAPKISFAHIDANLFQSTWESCQFTIPRTVPQGIVVFDDYNGVCDLGARLAIDKFLSGRDDEICALAGASAFLRIGKDSRPARRFYHS